MTRTLLAIALGLVVSAAHADTWTYRGTLNDGGQPANGRYDFRLTLLNGLVPVVKPITLYGVEVKNGQFAASVDFGVDLSMSPALKLRTDIATAQGFVRLGEPAHFDAKSTLAGVCWDTEGNAGTNPATNFIGTVDNQPFNIRANNQRIGQFAARGTASAWGDAPSVALGSAANVANAAGATVGGGGASRDSNGLPSPVPLQNAATAAFATAGGGIGNVASSFASTVGGGISNDASGPVSTISGGSSNIASGNRSTVSGGATNCAGGDFSWAGGFSAIVRPGTASSVGGICGANSGDANGDNGTFVWADDQGSSFTSTGPRQFLVRAQGGMAINSNNPAFGVTTGNASLTVDGLTHLRGDIRVVGSVASLGLAEMLGGVSVTGNVSVSNSGVLNFGNQTRQMLNLFGTTYGIGIQSARVYQRTEAGGGFNWFVGGVHNDATDNPGAGGAWRMHLGSVGNLLTSTGTIGTLSDARLKNQVVDYTHALDRINALRPVNYHYIDGGKAAFQPAGEQVGFIAQELQQVFPDWVLKGDDGYLQLSMRGFEAVAVRAIQELSAENQALKAELQSSNAMLLSRIEALELQLRRGRP